MNVISSPRTSVNPYDRFFFFFRQFFLGYVIPLKCQLYIIDILKFKILENFFVNFSRSYHPCHIGYSLFHIWEVLACSGGHRVPVLGN
jgi:hypothetical protein